MPRTVPCPHSASRHDEHDEDSPEYRECEEKERRRVRKLQRSALERFNADRLADAPSPAPSPAGSALTIAQKLAALANPSRPKDQLDGPSFGG